ncbi:hypothetical protein M0813_20622 [Anaeramoeba flamelloides]|uniref:MULE transposase domain-containing protein n=1 Tax=Anaeramoeba flamelloides TaxID=1746091 RepID=A0ABQ8YKH6_9EUKA|nr:hypothetical protein M0813_20622 [Anaeramoeba flamelloides]
MFVDGTFLSAPSPFTQLFIIAAYNEQTRNYYVCNYTLLQGKKTENYEFVFNMLKFLVPGLNPTLITSDFEQRESFKHTNGFLENNNGVLNKAFKNRKPGLNTLIYILKKHEDSQSRLFNSRMNKELKKDKNNYYNAREIEDRIEIEKSKWVKLQNQLKDTHFSPVQEETQINYKNINKFYNSENVLKHRTNFNKAEKLKKKKTRKHRKIKKKYISY